MTVHQLALSIPLVLLAACVPRLVSVEGDDDGGTSSSSSTSTESTGMSTDPTDDPPDDTSSTSTETTLGFVPPSDYTSASSCDPWWQDCPAGEKCVPYASHGGNWDANKCVPIMGQQAPGEPCWYGGTVEATDDCDATSVCWDVLDGVGTCRPFCGGTADNPSCPEGSQCLIPSDGAINLCIPTCDPLVQDCAVGLGCYWANTDFNCIFTTQDLPAGAPCGYINDCAPGNMCVDAAVLPACVGSACCASFCNINLGPEQCDALPGTACVPFWEPNMALPGYEHIGICIVP